MPLPVLAAAAKPILGFLGKNALPLLGGLFQGGASLFANKKLTNAQKSAMGRQKKAQDKYNSDFSNYQSHIKNKLNETPQRKISDSLINKVVGQAQGNLYASQGRAAGVESQLDAARQSTADQAYRASQVARTPMDLMGAIGQMSANESSTLNQIEGQAAKDRVVRIDKQSQNLQSAIEKKSVFRNNADNLMFQDKRDLHNRRMAFDQQSMLQQMDTNLGFSQFNIEQAAALESQKAAGIQGFGKAIGGLTTSLMGVQNNRDKMANDLAISGLN